tara:strand:+ start:18 stop:689 length:672 start_codon:yes stop_codon:yes gene_type:complete
MINNKLKSLTILVFILFISCGRNNSKEVQQEKIKAELDSYKLDVANTKVIWNGYKTNDKVKVVGYFNEFSTDRENQEFNSIDELVSGLKFSIKSSTSLSGDPIRDKNLKDYFFKYLTEGFVINGNLAQPINDSIDVTFDVFGQKKILRFGCQYSLIPDSPNSDYMIKISGSLDLESQFGGLQAFSAISKKCYDLHKGADGVSKTWKQVDVLIKALVLNTSTND